MKKGKYTEEQIVDVLKRMEAGQKARDPGVGTGCERSDAVHLEIQVRPRALWL